MLSNWESSFAKNVKLGWVDDGSYYCSPALHTHTRTMRNSHKKNANQNLMHIGTENKMGLN